MVFLTALLIYLVIAVVTWAVAVALYLTFVGGPDPRHKPGFYKVSAVTVALVALASTLPFSVGYLVSLGIWWATVMALELEWPRTVALFLFLAVLSYLSRLALLGALHVF